MQLSSKQHLLGNHYREPGSRHKPHYCFSCLLMHSVRLSRLMDLLSHLPINLCTGIQVLEQLTTSIASTQLITIRVILIGQELIGWVRMTQTRHYRIYLPTQHSIGRYGLKIWLASRMAIKVNGGLFQQYPKIEFHRLFFPSLVLTGIQPTRLP